MQREQCCLPWLPGVGIGISPGRICRPAWLQMAAGMRFDAGPADETRGHKAAHATASAPVPAMSRRRNPTKPMILPIGKRTCAARHLSARGDGTTYGVRP